MLVAVRLSDRLTVAKFHDERDNLRKRSHPATITYIERRLQEGKTRREANRCLNRYLARSLYRLLEHGAPLPT